MSAHPDSSARQRGPYRALLRLAVLSLLGALAAAGLKSYRDLAAAREQEARLEAQIVAARARIAELVGRLERLESDPGSLERLARQQLGMVRPGELVIVLPEEPGSAVAEPPAVAGDGPG